MTLLMICCIASCPCLDYEAVDTPALYQEAVVTVLFRRQMHSTKRKPRRNARSGLHYINKRSFTRFIALFRLESDTRCEDNLKATSPFGKIRYLVVDINHQNTEKWW
jgi:hypothetical protein